MNMHAPHHTTSKNNWCHSMQETSDKGPIIHLNKHILKYDKRYNLAVVADQTHQLYKWLKHNDKVTLLSSDLWENPTSTCAQKNMPNQIPYRTTYGPCPITTLVW